MRDVRKLAEGSKRFVTGGMDAAGVLAICLRLRKIKAFAKVSCRLKCNALYKKGSEGALGKLVFSRDALTTLLLTRPMDALATNFC